MKRIFLILIIILCVSKVLADGAKYLIITPDSFVQAVQPLANWKTKKGIKAKVVPLSVIGNTTTQIKSYITNAYNSWEIRPEYVLLAGFGSVIPVSGTSDDYYADITGNYRIELSVGRLPCSNVTQCNVLVSKILGYERTPYLTDSLWFKKGTTIVVEDNPPDQYYQADCRYIRNLMLSHGFVQIDSFLSTLGNNSSDVMNAINDGRSYVIYRGSSVVNWGSPFNQVIPDNLINGFKLPVVISGTCATVSLTTTGYLADKFLLAGTAHNPKGAVAYFGTTVATHYVSQYRSAVTKGFFQALFVENKYILGDVTKRAKFTMDSIYNNQTRYNEWNLLGDPELHLWTETPKSMVVSHDSVINNLQQNYTVLVTCNGIPLPGACVCLLKDTTVYQYSNTDSSGIVLFNIYPRTPGTMSLTVTARNMIPYEKNISVVPANLEHNVGVISIVDPVGTIAAGTNVIPKIKVINIGNHTDKFPVICRIDSIYSETQPAVVVNPGDTSIISFPNWVSIIGNHSIIAFCALDNDQWRGNDTIQRNFNVIYLDDIGTDSILNPGNTCFIGRTIIPRARIKNYGLTSETDFSVVCSIVNINGNLRYTDNKTISLATGRDTIVDFLTWIPTIVELCMVKIRTYDQNDMNSANDSITIITYVSSAIQDTIGTGTSYTNYNPINRSYNYSSHEAIYFQQEINAEGYITSIAYFKDHGTNTYPIENVIIYMKHTSSITLGSGDYSLTGYTEVFSGSFTNDSLSGWMEITLTTPFSYNNIDNLQILVLKGFQQYISGYPYWRYTTTSPNYCCRYGYNDYEQPVSLYQSYNRPNIMLTMAIQSPIANDVGVVSIISPTGYQQPYTIIPKAKIRNYGVLSQINFPVICNITNTNGQLRYTDTVIVPSISYRETLRVNFRPWTPTITEICTVSVRTALLNDSNPTNDQKTRTTNINYTVQVDVGTATSNSFAGPMNRTYNYSSSEAIYLQSEICAIGTINHIAYFKDNGTDMNQIASVTIYMKHATETQLANGNFSLDGYSQVYSGSFPNNADSGWITIQLMTPFEYNNVDNLQVLVLKGYQQYISTTVCPYWRYSATNPVYCCRQSYSDANIPASLTQTYNRPNIRLTIQRFMNDVGVRGIMYPLSLHRINGLVRPTVNLMNYGALVQYNIPVICSICGTNNTLRYYDTLRIESLASRETTSVSFSVWQPTISETCITIFRTNATPDENPDNNRKTKITYINPIYLQENFSDTIFPPQSWTIISFDHGYYTWVRNTNNSYSTPACVACRLDTGSLVNNDWLITPRIGPVRTGDSLIFYFRAHLSSHYETLLVKVSTGENASDTQHYTILDLVSNNSTTYIRQALDLSNYADSLIYIAFQYRCRQLQIYLDDITVRGFEPEGITTDKIYIIPFITMLYPSIPNPVKNSTTRISFSLAEPTKVSLRIFDISGRIVKTLADNQMNIGLYHYNWNCKDENSKSVAQGIYFYTLETTKQKFTKKLVLMK